MPKDSEQWEFVKEKTGDAATGGSPLSVNLPSINVAAPFDSPWLWLLGGFVAGIVFNEWIKKRR